MKPNSNKYIRVVKDLEEILNSDLDPSLFPYQKGNSLRVGKYGIRVNKRGFYKIFDCTTNTLVAETFCKSSAVALARQLTRGNNVEKKIMDLDKTIQKWYNDCMFYKHTIKVTSDYTKRDVVETRYQIAKYKTTEARAELDKYIYA